MNKKQELEQLKGIGKILDNLWENSYYSMGRNASERIEKEMIYFFGEDWPKDMYKIIESKGCRPKMPRPLKELLKTNQAKDN